MSKILPATCSAASVVTVENKPVQATILSNGKAQSTGVVLLEQDKSTYLTSNASDIHDLIVNIGSLVDQIKLCLNGLDGVTASPGSNAAAIAVVDTLKAQLLAQKDLLK